MYTATELKNLTIKPRINDITLQLLADYYTIFLNLFIFKYSIKNTNKNIELWFDKECFCHLVGLETVAKNSVPFKDLYKFRGINGWNNIYGKNNDGFIIDIPYLKNLNKRKFKNMKAKFVYFYLLPNLIANPLSVRFKNEHVSPPTRIDCDIMFYSKVKDDNAIIHLGIKENEITKHYIPKTFFVEKVSSKQEDIYLAQQEEIKTIALNKTIML